jgi:hypothetical protein
MEIVTSYFQVAPEIFLIFLPGQKSYCYKMESLDFPFFAVG